MPSTWLGCGHSKGPIVAEIGIRLPWDAVDWLRVEPRAVPLPASVVATRAPHFAAASAGRLFDGRPRPSQSRYCAATYSSVPGAPSVIPGDEFMAHSVSRLVLNQLV